MQTRQDFNTNLDFRLWSPVIMSYYKCKKKKKVMLCRLSVCNSVCWAGANAALQFRSINILHHLVHWQSAIQNMRFVHHYCHNIEVEWLLQITWPYSYGKHATCDGLWLYIPWNHVYSCFLRTDASAAISSSDLHLEGASSSSRSCFCNCKQTKNLNRLFFIQSNDCE